MYCLSFFRMRLLAGLQYKAAAVSGVLTQLFFGFMELLMYRAFYRTAPELLPMDMQALSSYLWLKEATFSFWFIYLWEMELFQSVQTGTVAYELVRPVNLYAMWSARGLALRLSRGIARMFPILIVGALLPAPYGLRLTISAAALGLFVLSFCLMLWLCVSFGILCYGLTFYLTDPRGIIAFLPAVAEVLSGDLLPIPFYPGLLRRIAEWSPFGSMQNVPLRIFGGDIAGAAIIRTMGLQLFWCILVTAAGYSLMQRGLRRIAVAGG